MCMREQLFEDRGNSLTGSSVSSLRIETCRKRVAAKNVSRRSPTTTSKQVSRNWQVRHFKHHSILLDGSSQSSSVCVAGISLSNFLCHELTRDETASYRPLREIQIMQRKPLIGINADFRTAKGNQPSFSVVTAGYYDSIARCRRYPCHRAADDQ